MAEPPRDRSEFWIRFVCTFFFFGAVMGFVMFGTSVSIQTAALVWAVATISVSWHAARVGDEAWVKLTGWISGFIGH